MINKRGNSGDLSKIGGKEPLQLGSNLRPNVTGSWHADDLRNRGTASRPDVYSDGRSYIFATATKIANVWSTQ